MTRSGSRGPWRTSSRETEPARLDAGAMRELVLNRDPDSAAVLERLQREHPLG